MSDYLDPMESWCACGHPSMYHGPEVPGCVECECRRVRPRPNVSIPPVVKQCGWCAELGHTTDEHNAVRPDDLRYPPGKTD